MKTWATRGERQWYDEMEAGGEEAETEQEKELMGGCAWREAESGNRGGRSDGQMAVVE